MLWKNEPKYHMMKLILPDRTSQNVYKRIKNPVRKVLYLFALHSSKKNFKEHEDKLVGVLDMIEGIEYHYKKIHFYEKAARRLVIEHERLKDDEHS